MDPPPLLFASFSVVCKSHGPHCDAWLTKNIWLTYYIASIFQIQSLHQQKAIFLFPDLCVWIFIMYEYLLLYIIIYYIIYNIVCLERAYGVNLVQCEVNGFGPLCRAPGLTPSGTVWGTRVQAPLQGPGFDPSLSSSPCSSCLCLTVTKETMCQKNDLHVKK